MTPIPRILCIGGQDPTGGAGIQADIETVTALGGQAMTLVTALTVQDSHNIRSILPTAAAFFSTQMDTLMNDIRPDAVKIGLLGSRELIVVLQRALQGFAGPVVLDPVLAAGGGFDLDDDGLGAEIRTRLLPLSTLATPNRAEARRLGGSDDPMQAALAMLEAGTKAVLMTGADESVGDQVSNVLLTCEGGETVFSWPRLPHRYHGSGCTLASACATRLALGDDLLSAVGRAQEFTWQALDRATLPGSGQWLPRRSA